MVKIKKLILGLFFLVLRTPLVRTRYITKKNTNLAHEKSPPCLAPANKRVGSASLPSMMSKSTKKIPPRLAVVRGGGLMLILKKATPARSCMQGGGLVAICY